MYGIVERQHIFDIVANICQVLGNGANESANKLILGTIAAETMLGEYKDPTPFRAGTGICQFDKIAFQDVKARTRKHNTKLILENFNIDIHKVTYDMLEYNPLLSIIFCRLFYKLIPAEIPSDLYLMACYWKRYYNTEQGKGTVEHFIGNYHHFIGGQ